MTKRLTYSHRGLTRLIQIASAQLCVFVEGDDDLFFYQHLCEAALGNSIAFTVRLAREISGSLHGKPGLKNFFEYLRRRRSLLSDFSGKKTAILFIADKDIDDILRNRLRSSHFIYTEHYEMENYVYLHGNIIDSLASLFSIDAARLAELLGPDWRANAAIAWKHWVILCIMVQKLGISFESTFGSISRINIPCIATTDMNQFQSLVSKLRRAAGLNSREFAKIQEETEKVVERLYSSGKYDSVFRGKWYPVFLINYAGSLRSRNIQREMLTRVIQLTVPYNTEWSSSIRERISHVAQSCLSVPLAH